MKCPKCNGKLVQETCINSNPIGIPLFERLRCPKCEIGTADGVKWWTKKGRWYPKKA